MADALPTSQYYSNLGGINQKASKYEMTTAQFLDIRNMDFDVPKALQKRPGSTFGIGSSNGTSGPIQSIFEFSKLTGESYIIAASDTALFYVAANAFTLLASGWNNGQPVDMNTFVNKVWMANGQNYSWWTGATYQLAGFRSPPGVTYSPLGTDAATFYTVAGITCSVNPISAATYVVAGIWLGYSYLRADGYNGPVNFLRNARNIVQGNVPTTGQEYFSSAVWGVTGQPVSGFTIGTGATGFAIWVAYDRQVNAAIGFPNLINSDNGIAVNTAYQSFGGAYKRTFTDEISAAVDTSKFYLFTSIPATTATFLLYLPNWSSFIATAPQSFSGLTIDFFATYTPRYIEQHKNIMFYSGFSAAPSDVWFSDIGTPESIAAESTFEVRTNDGDRVYGMLSFNNYLLVMKEHSFHKLIGDNADNFQLIQLSTDYGCLSQQTCLTIEQSAFWLDKKGILEFNGASWSIISGPIEGIFRRMNVSAAKEKAVGVHHIYRNQIWFGIPVDGSTVNNLTVVYDYLVQGWTFFDGYNATSYAYIKGALNRPTAWRGDQSGMIHYTGESFYSDSGNGITCLPFTRFENDGGENQTTIWRRFFLDVAQVTGASTPIQAKVFSNYDQTTVQATFQMFQGQFQSRAEMGVVGKAVAIQLSHYSASLPLLINGYGLAKRGLRNV